MIEKIKIIQNSTFSDIIGSEKVLILMEVYSYLWLGGQATGLCELCHSKYYSEIKTKGMEQLQIVEEIKNRTLIPNWIGNKYINGSFFNQETITDTQAISALKNNVLRESHFIKLPAGYDIFTPEQPEIKAPTNISIKKKAKK